MLLTLCLYSAVRMLPCQLMEQLTSQSLRFKHHPLSYSILLSCILYALSYLSNSIVFLSFQYACFTVGPITYNEIRIGSRSPSMSDDELAEKEKVLADQGIEYRELKVVDHEGCQYDINDGAQ